METEKIKRQLAEKIIEIGVIYGARIRALIEDGLEDHVGAIITLIKNGNDDGAYNELARHMSLSEMANEKEALAFLMSQRATARREAIALGLAIAGVGGRAIISIASGFLG